MAKYKKYSIKLFHLPHLEVGWLKDISEKLIKTEFNEEEGYGFKEIEYEDEYLTGILINKVNTHIYEYDILKKEVVQQKVSYYTESSFGFDFNHNLFEVFCPIRDIPRLKASFNNFFNNIKFNPLNLSPNKIIPILDKKMPNYSIINMAIINYRHNEYASGNFTANIKKSSEGQILVDEYKNDVSKITVRVDLDKLGAVNITFSNTGKMEIKCHEGTFIDVYTDLKNKIFKNG